MLSREPAGKMPALPVFTHSLANSPVTWPRGFLFVWVAARGMGCVTNNEIIMNMNKTLWLAALALTGIGIANRGWAQVPGIIQYQGRVTSHGTNFTGKGGFKFAILETGITGDSLWSNDESSVDGSEPAQQVQLQVQDGLFIVGLGDTALPNMKPIPASIFAYSQLQLRIWFNDGSSGYAMLSPDQKITSVGFAMMAASVPNGAITASKLADGAVVGGKLGPDAVAGVNLLNQTITGAKIAANALTSTEIADSLLLQRLDLGGPLWSGSLSLFASGANEQRAMLTGDGNGSLLNMYFANNATGAVLFARGLSSGLRLSTPFGVPSAELGVGASGGELTLHRVDGNNGLRLDAEDTSGGGIVQVMSSGGNTATVELLGAETANSGGELRLRRADGTTTVIIDAENDGQGNPRIDLNKGDGTSTMVFVPGGGNVTANGGGLMRLGDLEGSNMGIDGDQILTRTNGAPGPLFLNYQSGGVVHTTRLTVNTATPAAGYSVSVNGKVICEELVVQNSAEWPDYVFAPDYPLMPLHELEASIQKHNHLPGVASAKQIGEEGIPLGQVQKQMMEKIEELTLYLLPQNKRLQAQENELQQIRTRIEAAQ